MGTLENDNWKNISVKIEGREAFDIESFEYPIKTESYFNLQESVTRITQLTIEDQERLINLKTNGYNISEKRWLMIKAFQEGLHKDRELESYYEMKKEILRTMDPMQVVINKNGGVEVQAIPDCCYAQLQNLNYHINRRMLELLDIYNL
ncbi:hypothetical protein [Brumimicrobium mesophilum]|uniref:hypothetical protein n=1 Tax=Brumimicrobium mesophilum TaxID=392717 RepID=UPI000D1402B4|nr:hypothetical protein [Brumimicrobium mesophilum]